ncbi:MAG: 2OG-Fe(II) oxygenase family protein [Hyphomonadaceae bacterium]|nr:2OG-Fe(II) oxygenase family protein [Hyphomonadaceae bacterium]
MKLNPNLDAVALRSAFAAAGRLQIADFLAVDDAHTLSAGISDLDWQLVLNTGTRHVDLPRQQVAGMGKPKLAAILAEVGKQAATSFQYLYENYPVTDLVDAGTLSNPHLRAIHDLMNSADARGFLESVTGRETDFCDMQATRYSAGHFLTVHDDDAGPAKNRKLAYVLSLTEGWAATWGGQLQFLNSEGGVSASFAPKFNALSVFAVPAPHHVSQVASFAPKGRISLTGWFRTR